MRILIFIGFVIICSQLFGQKDSLSCHIYYDSLSKREVYSYVDSMPEPVGGMSILQKKIMQELVVKDVGCWQGSIYVGFVVDSDSTIVGQRSLRNSAYDRTLDKQVMDIISGVKWKPGYYKGVAVPVFLVLPVKVHPK